MGSTTSRRLALLSIHPEYANAILDGRKRVEFRRGRLADDIEIVLVYATKPVGEIVGFFEVEAVVEDAPHLLWRRFRECAGIDASAYKAYFSNAKKGFGISIRQAVRLDRPKSLRSIDENLVAPQSFRYLPMETLALVSR